MENNKSHSDVFLENELLLENLQGGIVYSDFNPPFALRYVTEGMTHLSGYSQEELLQMEQMDLVKDEDIEHLTHEVAEQFSKGDTFEVEYNLKCKNGSFVYILDRAKVVTHDDGNKYIHCLLTDISSLKQMEQELRLNEEKYKLAIQESGNVILELDVASEKLSFSDNYAQIFAGPAPQGTLTQIAASEWIASNHRAEFLSLFSKDKSLDGSSMELQLKNGDGKYVWCCLHVSPVFRGSHNLYAYVGCLQNIDEQKHHLDHLTQLAQIDGLTGVYNRVTFEQYVEQHVKSNNHLQSGALVILDIDFFKQINDSFGHSHGDDILIKLASVVQGMLPDDSFFGRLGGDEFLIYFPSITMDSEITSYSAKIKAGIEAAFAGYAHSVTVSLGASLKNPSITCFNDFYKQADSALYLTKKKGRNSYTIFK